MICNGLGDIMKTIKMFEIPIYSMLEVEYKKRCYRSINERASMTSSDNYESFYSYLENLYYKNRPWKYNQMVGYIIISFKEHSIWFDEYCVFDKRIKAVANTKHIIKNMKLNGHHFYLRNDMDNTEIKHEIIKWIEGIEKNIINKPLWLDKDMFLLQLDCVDIKKMIGSD